MKPEALAVRKLVEDIQAIESEIESLQEQKMRLEYQLDQVVAPSSATVSASNGETEVVRKGRVPSENSVKRVIANFIEVRPQANFTATDIARETEMHVQTVRTNLSRLVREGVIEKRSFNTYGALTAKTENQV